MSATRKRLAGALGLVLVASGLLLAPSAPAQAASSGLIINEVYGGGGSTSSSAAYKSDFVELYNPTGGALSLNGLSLQYRTGTYNGTGAVSVLNLPNQSVPAGSHFLVQVSSPNNCSGNPCGGADMPSPDFSGTALNMAAGSGQVILAQGATTITATGTAMQNVTNVVDFVGYGTATSSEAAPTGTALTSTTSASRSTHVDHDNNSTDFAAPATPSPTAATVVATPLEVTDPGDKTGYAGTPIAPITLAATGGVGPYTWQATGLPADLTLSGNTISGTPEAAGTSTVTITATDSATPTHATDSETFDIVVEPALAITPIAEIQGDGARSPMAPPSGNASGTEIVTTEGVVTARYATGGFNGMYIETPGADTADASDGIFVYAGSGNANIPVGIDVGDSVQVTGPIAEFFDLTQIVPASAGAVTELGTSLGTVTPRAIAYPTTDSAREVREGELLAPTGAFTVTNNYSTNQYGEIGLATGTTPLRQPTEYASPHDMDAIDAVKAENLARGVVLDDGATTNFLANQTTKAIPVPWLTPTNPVRVGAGVDFQGPVVLDWRNNVWKFQPTHQVTDAGADVATFEDTRTTNLAPQNVGGDLKIATFNVLNYFNTTGEAYVLAGPQQNPPVNTACSYYTDRAGNRIGNNTCGVVTDGVNAGNGPRGAATAASLDRQEAKLTHTLNALNADVIGLEEVENSIKLPGETNRDDAVARIVQILNDAAGETKWAYVKSPGEAVTASAVAEQDVIRPAFIYQVDRVTPVGQSDILFGSTQFANAREPLAQAFKAKGAPDRDAFAVIVNHFKSKGDNAAPAPPASGDNATDEATGVGAFNGDRVRQAQRLVQFANDFAADRGIDAVFLAGDFNAYTMEDPITTLEDGGYELIDSDDPNDESYSFGGNSGSLDHVLGNAAAVDMVTGADIWEINADESIAFQYSRYNYNVTNFWQPNLPFATSDHNPEIIGIDVPDSPATTYREIQVIGTNDFHGRLLPDGGNAAGAAPFATAVKQLKSEIPDSIFVAAGDLVGASTFESFIQDDEPTIDALNAMDLEVSAAGNHEFDRGYADFVGRIQDRAQWEYIAANVEEPNGADDLAETFTKTFGTGDDALKVGFVGAVTEDLPALVNPAGIQGVTVTDIVDATNAAAATLKSGPDPVDLVVLLVHEGSPTTECSSASFTDPATVWGNIVQNTSSDVDAIISGHTHLAYNCRFPVADWASRAVTKRPVVSAGQYGTNLNQLVFKLDETTGELASISQDVIATAGVGYAADPEVQGIVDDAVAYAQTAGAAVLGQMEGPFNRARYLPQGVSTENRGGESTLNNQVAEVQRWATDEAGIDTDIAFMNPGGLRADMTGTPSGELRNLTYRQAADVQPFANTLVNMELTGAQIETVLEQQWQRNAQGGVPSRPFLRLGVSQGFTYTYVETPETVNAPNSAPVNTFKGEVTGMWLDGEPIDPAATYSVTVNSFLGTGGDNFWELANGTDKVDSGQVDLQAMVDYMEQYASEPLAVDYSQRAVEVKFPNDAPEEYSVGDTISLDVASWAMTAQDDVTDSQILLKLGDETIGTSGIVDNARSNTPYDNAGKAHIEGTVPAGVEAGENTLMLVGNNTGTEIPVDVTLDDGVEEIQILATNDFHGRIQNDAASAAAGAAVLSGAVKQLRMQNPNTVFAAAGDLIGASTFESFIQNDKPTIDALNEAGLEVSAVGNHELDQGYDDLVNRVMAAESADNTQGGAEWEYIAANLKMKETGDPAVPATFMKTMGGIDVGFVGAVTEDLPSLVSPAGIEDIEVTDIVDSVNESAEDLRADGAELVIMLVHEGAPNTNCATMADPETTWGHIVTGVNDEVDAIVSGHTHLEYNCSFPVAGWSGREVTERPVVSAGQYGANLNQLVFTVDSSTGEVLAKSQAILKLKSCTNSVACTNFPADPEVGSIVNDAVAEAETLGAQVLGQIDGGFNRAKLSNGTTENRGGESSLGNLVAEVQRWATEAEESGSAQIAFMNPGGLRADMTGVGTGAFPRDLTYKQAAVVQPFANTLVNMDLTGANIKLALEQQWQRDGGGAIPSRPFLRLGVSKGFTYTYDPALPEGSRITGMWLDGEPIDPAATYSVTVNSFLASGGDNFRAFNNGTDKRDTGKVDLQAMVDYMDEHSPVAVDYSQRSVGVSFPGDAPEEYQPGDSVEFALSSLAMSAPGDVKDTEVTVSLDGEVLDTFPVTNTIGNAVFDEYGTAAVDVTLPEDLETGEVTLTVTGNNTGTEVPVTVAVLDTVREIQILATNDFHGRILNNTNNEAGAAVLSGAVKQLREENPDTVFAAAGDLIGASTFESFIQQDEPTIDALNEAGLEVSAAGNHEFDQGYEDLVGRVQDRANWEYIAANVEEPVGRDDLAETWTKTFGSGDGAVEVGFVGAVTEDLPSLVSPAGIEGVTVTDIVDATNAAAADLKADGADLVVLLVHEGATSTNCGTMTDPSTTWGNIVTGVNGNVDAIVSGHTHLSYNCSFPVPSWVTASRAVTERPVVSAGQYGSYLNKLVFTVDGSTGEVTAKTQQVVELESCGSTCAAATPTWTANFPADPAVTSIVNDAVAQSEVLGAQVLGQIGGGFNRAKLSNGTTENRGGESTLGNLVAEVQRWATETPEAGAADIAFMNPGGLRADMTGTGSGAFPRDLTYKQAAVVQPFANTLVNLDLTGANIKLALEQQWQRDGSGNVPSRPFLRLGISKGFTYTYDPAKPEGSRITGMWLNGEPIAMGDTYSVTVNSFLASGGDNFRAFNNGTDKRDTGKVDLEAMVDYMDEHSPVPVDYSQRSVGVTFPNDAPTSYLPGDHVKFSLTSLAMSAPGDTRDANVEVFLGDTSLGVFPVTNTIGNNVFDEYGTASVDVVVPGGTSVGAQTLTVRGAQTGTEVPVTIQVAAAPPTTIDTTTTATGQPMKYGTAGTIQVTVTPAAASGPVSVTENGTTVATGTVTAGSGSVALSGTALEPGTHTLVVRYEGNSAYNPSQTTITVQVAKADTTLTAEAPTVDYGDVATVNVSTMPGSATGTVTVSEGGATLGQGSLASGSASISIGSGLAPGSHTLTVTYAGDAKHAEATATATLLVRKAASSTSATTAPGRIAVESGVASVKITVSAGDLVPTGQVRVLVNGRELDRGQLANGKVTLQVGPFSGTGVKSLEITYDGDDRVAGSTTTSSVQVVKAEPTVTADHNPNVVKAGKTKVKLTVKVKADGFEPGGSVTVTVAGRSFDGRLDHGKVVFNLGKFTSPGTKTVTIDYEGDGKTQSATIEHDIKVVKKR